MTTHNPALKGGRSLLFLGFLSIAAFGFLVGCNDDKISIAGQISADLVQGSEVSCISLAGEVLETVGVDADNRFYFTVDGQDFGDGFLLSVTSGQVFDMPIAGNLRALYKSDDNLETANITLLTTLVTACAEASNANGRELLTARDDSTLFMSGLGMLDSADWFQTNPSRVNKEGLKSTMLAFGGIKEWTEVIIEDLADGELSTNFMEAFPFANGGILKVTFDRNCFAGKGEVVPLLVSSAQTPPPVYTFEFITAPDGLTLNTNGNIVVSPPPEAFAGPLPFTLRIVDPNTGLGRTVSDSIYVMSTEVIITGQCGPEGGVFYDEWDEISLEVPVAAVSSTVVFQMLKALTEDGETTYSLRTVPDSVVLKGSPILSLAEPVMAALESKMVLDDAKGNTEWNVWQETYAFFLQGRLGSLLTPNRVPSTDDGSISLLQSVGLSYKASVASRLSSLCGPQDDFHLSSCANGEPVILVHGFELFPTQLGGEDTWGDLPELLAESGYAVFQFNYRSCARFQDISTDLAFCIRYIHHVTGKKVHVVAHSFGGLVSRSYIQGLSNVQFGNDIASLITLGTPHSGIFTDAGVRQDIFFPEGSDPDPSLSGWLASSGLTSQISVYQAGGLISHSLENIMFLSGLDYKAYFRLSDEPGEIPAQLAAKLSDYPSTVPTLSLIGLKCSAGNYTTGDGLIHYQGQRFCPGLSIRNNAAQSRPLSDRNIQGLGYSILPGNITERVLYFPQDAVPGNTVPTPYKGHDGYAHTSLFGGNYAEAEVMRTTIPDTLATPTPEAGKRYHYGYIEIMNWLANHRASEMGSDTLSVKVHVLDAATALGVPNALVQPFVSGNSLGNAGYTNANGYLTLEIPFLPNSNYALGIVASGYKPLRNSGMIFTSEDPADAIYELGDLYLQPMLPGRGALMGKASDADSGEAIPNAECELSNGIRSYVAYTDLGGSFLMSDIAAGSWLMSTSKNGYRTKTQTVIIRSGDTTEAIVRMRIFSESITPPTVINFDPDENGWVGNTSAYFSGRIEEDGGADIIDAYVGYGKRSDRSDWVWHKSADLENPFRILVNDLEYGTCYYCQTTARNEALPESWSYGQKYQFCTDSRQNLPELAPRVNRFVPSGVLYEGNQFRFSSSFVNLGDRFAPQTYTRIYLSTDNDFAYSDDYYIGEFRVSSLEPGEETWIQHYFTMPHLRAGLYNVWVVTVVDVYDSVSELSENSVWKTLSEYPFHASGNPQDKELAIPTQHDDSAHLSTCEPLIQ